MKVKVKTNSALSTIISAQNKDQLFTPEEAAEYIGVTTATLAVWRCVRRYNLQYIKVGRLVKYRKSGLDAFLDSRTHGVEV